MKKKAVIAMAVVIVVLTAGVIISRGKMPYKDLKASDRHQQLERHPRRDRGGRSGGNERHRKGALQNGHGGQRGPAVLSCLCLLVSDLGAAQRLSHEHNGSGHGASEPDRLRRASA